MGAGILPTTIHKGKLHFLFGKENKYEKSAPGFADFGGGTDDKESLYETAVREATEELTGFLGDADEIKKLLNKHGTYNIDYKDTGHHLYRMHIFPIEYDQQLPFYYNNNQRFLQKKLSPTVIKGYRIFEKEEIRWISIDEIPKMKGKFRNYFENIIDILLAQKEDVKKFIVRSLKPRKMSKSRSFKRKGMKTRKLRK